MNDREQAAIRYLRQEYMWHVDMLEALRRGRGEVIYFEGKTVLIRRNEAPGSYLLTADSPEAGAAAFAGLPAPQLVVARGPGVPEMVGERFGLFLSNCCCNVAYLKAERLSWDCPGLVLRPFRLEELPAFLEHYSIEGEEEARAHIEKGELFAAEYKGQLAGFMGFHGDGSMGLLETFPEYRNLGIGRAIEKFFINLCLDRGWVPYGQVFCDNEKSFSLQAHLGMTVDRSKTLRWCLPPEDDRA